MTETLTLFGIEISVYYLCWFLGVIAAYILGCAICKNYGLDIFTGIMLFSFALMLCFVLMWLMSQIFREVGSQGLYYVRIVPYLPLVVWFLARLFKLRYDDVSDFLFPLTAIELAISKIGCVFAGCCHGYPSEWGIYSNISRCTCFPIQIVEGITLLLIAVLLLVFRKMKVQQGRLYAWYLLLYGSSRFVWEFFRDNKKIWNGLSELSLHALAAVAIGLFSILIMNRQHRKGSEQFEKDKA